MKSHESDQVEMLRCIYIDACSKCTADVSDLRDMKTIMSRVEEEGLSFLTISLPNFARDFDKSLAIGYIDSTAFQGFRKTEAIPAFLQGMLSQIFDRETGRLYTNDSPDFVDRSVIVESVRQICRAFTKLQIECTPERVHKAIEGFVQTEHDLAEFTISNEILDRFRLVSHSLWDICLSGYNPDSITLRHGPGTTADKRTGNRKFDWREWYTRLEDYFPFLGNAYPIGAAGELDFDRVTFIPEGRERPVKVTPVPKTQKGPRIIAIEPTAMQYVQGGIRAWLYARIGRSRMAGGHVNFDDQSVNQEIAIDASKTGEFATIDLSDASDRVPLSLVREMFMAALGSNLLLWDTIEACRSKYAELPDGRVIGPLLKFASMGSALCFPIEAMYFYTACIESLLRLQSLPVTRENVYDVSRSVYVYGDDILIPRAYAVAVMGCLSQYNCKVNTNKSYWNGKFRESCGVDAYDGANVTPTYVRRLLPYDRRQSSELISTCETASLFYKRGYWRTAEHLYKRVERHLGKLPYVSDNSFGLGRTSFLGGRSVERWNARFQRFEVKLWVPSPVHRTDELEGYAALAKSLSFLEKNGQFTFLPIDRDPLHLERTARYGVVTLKSRWGPVD